MLGGHILKNAKIAETRCGKTQSILSAAYEKEWQNRRPCIPSLDKRIALVLAIEAVRGAI